MRILSIHLPEPIMPISIGRSDGTPCTPSRRMLYTRTDTAFIPPFGPLPWNMSKAITSVSVGGRKLILAVPVLVRRLHWSMNYLQMIYMLTKSAHLGRFCPFRNMSPFHHLRLRTIGAKMNGYLITCMTFPPMICSNLLAWTIMSPMLVIVLPMLMIESSTFIIK